MRPELTALCDALHQTAIAAAHVGAENVFRRSGGVYDPQLRVTRMIDDLGPRRAAELSRSFVHLKQELRRLYGLRPDLVLRHVELMTQLVRRGWIRLKSDEAP